MTVKYAVTLIFFFSQSVMCCTSVPGGPCWPLGPGKPGEPRRPLSPWGPIIPVAPWIPCDTDTQTPTTSNFRINCMNIILYGFSFIICEGGLKICHSNSCGRLSFFPLFSFFFTENVFTKRVTFQTCCHSTPWNLLCHPWVPDLPFLHLAPCYPVMNKVFW